MNYYNKLKILLCECEEVKRDIMELKFWTELNCVWRICKLLVEKSWYIDVFNWDWVYSCLHWNYTIIWNPLEERHLRIYLIKHKLNLFNIYRAKFIYEECYIELDNSKAFSEQSEEVYEKLYNYLIKK